MNRRQLLLLMTSACAMLAAPASGQPIPSANEGLPRYDLRIGHQPEINRFEVAGTITLPPSSSVREEVELSLAEAMGDP